MRLAVRHETTEHTGLDHNISQHPERQKSRVITGKRMVAAAVVGTLAVGCGPGESGSPAPNPGSQNISIPSQSSTPKTKTLDVYRAGGDATVTATGASVSLRIEKPSVGKRDVHSLSELALRTAKGVLEVGWTVDPSIFKDTNPHLFVFPTKDQQDPACYNACGFTPVAGATIHAGAALPVGGIHRFGAYHSSAHKEWELFYGNKEFGFVPDSDLGDLGSNGRAGAIAVYGEVIADHTPPTPCTQMGDGKLGKASLDVIDNPTYRNEKLQQETLYLGVFADASGGHYEAALASDDRIHYGGGPATDC
jgi:hypothetical protein